MGKITLEAELKEVVDKNIPIRILTGNYLNITQPQALYMLKDIMGDKVDLRFYNVPNKSFHPKAYIFQYEKGGDLYIGSSNISRSALNKCKDKAFKLSVHSEIIWVNSKDILNCDFAPADIPIGEKIYKEYKI